MSERAKIILVAFSVFFKYIFWLIYLLISVIVVCVDRRSLIIVNTISRGYFVEWFSGVGKVASKVLLIVELVQQQ